MRSQASHLLEGYGLYGRDINPHNVVFESGLSNKSRWFCSQHLVQRLTAKLGEIDHAKIGEALSPIPNKAKFETSLARSPAEAADEAPAALASAKEIVNSFSQPGFGEAGPSQQPSQQPSQGSQIWASCVTEVHEICQRVHNPPCRFWDYAEWGAFPLEAAWVGNSNTLAKAEGREAARLSVNELVDDFIRKRAGLGQKKRKAE